ncbi:mitochondrial inner membrane protease ATP23 isoform X1 [Selaginella moellendorffii]|uniref:mitochondrial inner membrane protease ATP23 isoform X1 n=1 Tax=Selaginella moellendorffii TaxID=88036 RepID=UPI000D1CE876|nr:mitochondrial inner membrane protease ATP23 isoform X1 [Selaginella moellendorffii]|eukprot:XP_024516909.1 mitochondrial inner membrane protease ATP23 isoform X1 [Selaginella moellendorffii]
MEDEVAKKIYGTSVERCEKLVANTLKRNPTVHFLREALDKAGCSTGSNFFKVEECEQKVAGGFQSDKGVVICSNRVGFQQEVDAILAHELIHAYDHCRARNLDWTNCEHHACSEIRAANLSGDCRFKQEFNRGNFGIQKHQQVCVRRRANLSVAMNPHCSKAEAASAVDRVWNTCYRDTRPFERAP